MSLWKNRYLPCFGVVTGTSDSLFQEWNGFGFLIKYIKVAVTYLVFDVVVAWSEIIEHEVERVGKLILTVEIVRLGFLPDLLDLAVLLPDNRQHHDKQHQKNYSPFSHVSV